MREEPTRTGQNDLDGARWGIVGASPHMQEVFQAIPEVACTDESVLIEGETGTGKDLVAHAVHRESPRSSAKFVPINCAAIPQTLLESELFGHRRGAFTGADRTRPGAFVTARGGTLFLDEVGELDRGAQAKLLRVVESGEVHALGDDNMRTVDVRIITASHNPLQSLIEKRRFRRDLFYRLSVLRLCLPPLRERGNDIVLLARHFLRKHAREYGRKPPELTNEAAEAALRSEWPGNVRELENVVKRLLAHCQHDRVDVSDLAKAMRLTAPPGKPAVHRTLAEVEDDHIVRVLASVDGNRTQAASILGISRETLRRKIARLRKLGKLPE